MAIKRAAPKSKDVFINHAYATVTESAPNTLTFGEINTGVPLFADVAWVIHRILWYPDPGGLALLVAPDDYLQASIAVSNKIGAATDLQDPAIIDPIILTSYVYGAPASAHLVHLPLVHDFSNLPGGGIIIPPKPVFLAAQGASLGGATTWHARLEFTIKQLVRDDFLELVQSVRMIS